MHLHSELLPRSSPGRHLRQVDLRDHAQDGGIVGPDAPGGWSSATWTRRLWEQIQARVPADVYTLRVRREEVKSPSRSRKVLDIFRAARPEPERWLLRDAEGALVKYDASHHLTFRPNASSERSSRAVASFSDLLTVVTGTLAHPLDATWWLRHLALPGVGVGDRAPFWFHVGLDDAERTLPATSLSSHGEVVGRACGVLTPLFEPGVHVTVPDGRNIRLDRGRSQVLRYGGYPLLLLGPDPANLLEVLTDAVGSLSGYLQDLAAERYEALDDPELLRLPEVEALAWLLSWRDAARHLAWPVIIDQLLEQILLDRETTPHGLMRALENQLGLWGWIAVDAKKLQGPGGMQIVPRGRRDGRRGCWRLRYDDRPNVVLEHDRLKAVLQERVLPAWWAKPDATPTREGAP